MFKKISLLLLVVVCSIAAKAQDGDYRKFRVGLGVGYARPSGDGAKAGVLLNLEPGYRITDAILANLRIESAIMARGSSSSSGDDFDVSVSGVGSYTVNGQYYLSSNAFRPYVGLGLGLYSLAAVEVSSNGGGSGDVTEAEAKFGLYPRIGFDVGHFTINIDYNIVPPTEGVGGAEFKNNYLGIRIGGYFGGGEK